MTEDPKGEYNCSGNQENGMKKKIPHSKSKHKKEAWTGHVQYIKEFENVGDQ